MSGFESYRENGTTLEIDSIYTSIALKRSLLVLSSQLTTVNSKMSWFKYELSVDDGDIIAYYSTGYVTVVSNINGKCIFYTYGRTNIEIYVFNAYATASTSGAGLEIYSASGKCLFNSNEYQMILVERVSKLMSGVNITQNWFSVVAWDTTLTYTLANSFKQAIVPHIFTYEHRGDYDDGEDDPEIYAAITPTFVRNNTGSGNRTLSIKSRTVYESRSLPWRSPYNNPIDASDSATTMFNMIDISKFPTPTSS